ncbi:hypothetical protein [Ruegeria sp. EL01]|uniref:hypothetical protein n=1 Tax=Ruegeria sp. EL01 TaxID=2107578 RepID=UPI000EA81473|nr:hypothetical protein [Ruegeria sp. EL01]
MRQTETYVGKFKKPEVAAFRAPFDNKVVNGLISYVGFPALVISHLSTASVDIGIFLNVMAAAVLIVVIWRAWIHGA